MPDQDWKSTFLSKLTEVFHIVLVFVGVAIVILAAAKGIKVKDWSVSIDDPTWQISLAVFGVIVMLVGLYLSLRKTGSTVDTGLPKAKDYEIRISYPTGGMKLVKADVVGVIKGPLPKEFRLWIFRHYNDGRFSPLRECVINENGNGWEAPNCDVGGKSGEQRWFSVNIVGPDGSALISYVREATQRFAPIREEFAAMSSKTDVPYLPSILERTRDIIQCASVKVERL